MKEFLDKLSSVVAVSLGVLVLFVLGTGLWAVRWLFPYVGAAFAVDLILLLTSAPFVVFLIARTYARYIPNEQYGGYLHGLFGKTTPLPPLALATPKVVGAAGNVTDITPQIPRLGELIVEGSLVKEVEGELLMLQGFRTDTTPRYGKWAGVIGVSGMQDVGKSVTIEDLTIIALLQRAKVVVIDLHHTKPRSLYKKLVNKVTSEQVLR